MSYLPILLNLNNKKVLVIGGGEIALRKIKFFLDFTKNITIIAKEKTKKLDMLILHNKLEFFQEEFDFKNFEKFDIVVAAVNDIDLQEEIYEKTRGKNVLYSCVDIKEYCDFLFPSYIKEEDLLITVSTNGKAPAFAKELKNYIKKLLPSSISEIINKMWDIRKNESKGEIRMKKLKNMAKEYFLRIK